MSIIAGVFYFDFRQAPEADQHGVLQAAGCSRSGQIEVVRGRGVLMAHAPSPHESIVNTACATLPDGSACIWDGRLDNREALYLRFGRESTRANFNSAMAALKQYKATGTQGLRDLIGDWSLAIWDAERKTVVLASDYAGVRPLYYHLAADRLYWSSSLARLAQWAGADRLNDEYAARAMLSHAVPRQTPYCGIHPIRPGHTVAISPEKISSEPFWRPPAAQELRLEDPRDYEEALRILFREAVAVRLEGGSPVCAELSGGLDSTSVVAMSDYLLPPDAKLVTFSHVHPGSRDEPYIRVAERTWKKIEPTRLDLRDFPFVTATQPGGAAPAWWQPRLAEIARRMEAVGSGVLLTGDLGDFTMGNFADDTEQVADLLRERRFREALHEAFAWSRSLQLPIYPVLKRALRSAYSPWISRETFDIWRGPAGPFTRATSLTSKLESLLDREDDDIPDTRSRKSIAPTRRRRFCALAELLDGRVLQVPEPLQHLSYTHPFSHRPLVEFMLTIPPGQVCRPGEPRRLMRRAFGPLLPDAILNRKSKAALTEPYRQALMPLATELLTAPAQIQVVELGYIERTGLLERLQRFRQGLDCNERQLRQIILYEFWLRNRNAAQPAPSSNPHSLQGTITSTRVPSPGALDTVKVAPI